MLQAHPEWEICGEAATGSEAIRKTKLLEPDILLLDLGMPDLSGLEAIPTILNIRPRTRILIFTMNESGQMATAVLAAGARGLVLKGDAGRDLVRAVEALGRDKPFLSPRVTEIIMRELAKDAVKGPSLADLTTREKEVLRLLAGGKGNKDVADVLGISFRTAEAHRASLMRKLNLRSMSDLVRFAIRHRIVEI